MQKQIRQSRGTAMSEMVLVMPLIALVLLLLIYFGKGVVRVQRAQVMDRYEAWHDVAAAPGPGADNSTNNSQLNTLFLGGKAETIVADASNAFPSAAADQLISDAFAISDETGQFVQRQHDRGDHGRSIHFSTDHPAGNAIVEQYEGEILHGHTRLGNDWAYVNGWRVATNDQLVYGEWERDGPYGPNVMASARDVFYQELDDDLTSLSSSLANGIRAIYLIQPVYEGPEIDID